MIRKNTALSGYLTYMHNNETGITSTLHAVYRTNNRLKYFFVYFKESVPSVNEIFLPKKKPETIKKYGTAIVVITSRIQYTNSE